MKHFVFYIPIMFILACTKEVEIDLPKQPKKMVVYSSLSPLVFPLPKELNLKLTYSKEISDSTNNMIKDALVLYYINNQLIDTVEFVDSLGVYPLVKNMSDYPITGDKCAIKIIKNGFESIYAETVIPTKVTIKDSILIDQIAYIDELGFAHSKASLTFTDPADEVNYYEIAVTQTYASNSDNPDHYFELKTNDEIITSQSYYPSAFSLELKYPKYLLFTDESFNGEEHTVDFFYEPPQASEEYLYILGHYLSFHLRNVSEDYYKYKTSLIQSKNNNTEDVLYGMGEPINVYSNIENGYGIFGAYNYDLQSFHFVKLKVQ